MRISHCCKPLAVTYFCATGANPSRECKIKLNSCRHLHKGICKVFNLLLFNKIHITVFKTQAIIIPTFHFYITINTAPYLLVLTVSRTVILLTNVTRIEYCKDSLIVFSVTGFFTYVFARSPHVCRAYPRCCTKY